MPLRCIVMKASLGVALLGLASCASDGEEPADDGKLETHYTLRTGRVVPHAPPFPTQTDIIVDWHYASGESLSALGFRGWDFTGNGRYQMVEVLDGSGQPTAYVFDFDGDGREDEIRQLGIQELVKDPVLVAPDDGSQESDAD